MKVKPLTSENWSGSFVGRVQDMAAYEWYKSGTSDWKPHVKAKMTKVVIPIELFRKFVEQDKMLDLENLETAECTSGELKKPCDYEIVEAYKNVTVIIRKCKDCGAMDLSWERQENTEPVAIIRKEEINDET